MSVPLLSVPPETEDKEVFELFDKYDLRSLVVVNEENCPDRVIAVDDVVSRVRAKLKSDKQGEEQGKFCYGRVDG